MGCSNCLFPNRDLLIQGVNISKKRVLISGASGLCGLHLVNYLDPKKNFEVFTTSRSILDRRNHIQHDLRKPVTTDIFPKKIDCIVHCAARVDEQDTSFDVINQNLKTTFNLLKYAGACSANSFINLSSIAVYGRPKPTGIISETHEFKPITNYGVSKVLVERACEALLPHSTKRVNLRLGYVLGPTKSKARIFQKFTEQMSMNEPIELINPDQTVFNVIDIEDFSRVVEIFLRNNVSGDFNLVSGHYPTVRDIFNVVKEHHPSYKVMTKITYQPSSVDCTKYSNDKLKIELNIRSFISYQKSLNKILSE